MRDGVRLSALILFPKDQSRRNLPTVLYRSPYLIDPREIERFAEFNRSFIENGYAIVIQNERGRYFSEGTYTFSSRSALLQRLSISRRTQSAKRR